MEARRPIVAVNSSKDVSQGCWSPLFAPLIAKDCDHCIFNGYVAWLSVWHAISQQPCEVEGWFQWKHMYRESNNHVTSLSLDPKRPRSWPQNIWSSISSWPCKIDVWLITYGIRKPHIASPMVVKVVTRKSFSLHISVDSITVEEKHVVIIDHL